MKDEDITINKPVNYFVTKVSLKDNEYYIDSENSYWRKLEVTTNNIVAIKLLNKIKPEDFKEYEERKS